MNHSLQFNWVYPDYVVFPSLVAVGGITMWSIEAFKLGRARERYGIKAPAVTGDAEFEKVVHRYSNLTEGLGNAVIPSTFMFSYFISPKWSLILGSSWLISKLVSCCSYCCKKEKDNECLKSTHLIVSHASQFLLLGGAGLGVIVSLINRCKLLHGK
ncbi:hypothetical protein CYY_006355 [Polysphondylium violaceum]|uniref:MAPEG family protein n=1 Tax=Polysphondylium violaceum TaxID=133409 RepID=A0A8J4PSD2_9MYCE|nr:hypothetical protein CYY_006355 [Polysphondylium violaceum]